MSREEFLAVFKPLTTLVMDYEWALVAAPGVEVRVGQALVTCRHWPMRDSSPFGFVSLTVKRLDGSTEIYLRAPTAIDLLEAACARP